MVRGDWMVDVGNIPVIPTLRRVRLEGWGVLEQPEVHMETLTQSKAKQDNTKRSKVMAKT